MREARQRGRVGDGGGQLLVGLPLSDETGQLEDPVDGDDEKNLDWRWELVFETGSDRIRSLVPPPRQGQQQEVDGWQKDDEDRKVEEDDARDLLVAAEEASVDAEVWSQEVEAAWVVRRKFDQKRRRHDRQGNGDADADEDLSVSTFLDLRPDWRRRLEDDVRDDRHPSEVEEDQKLE